MTPYDSVPLVGQYWSHLILDLSSSLVNITIVEDLCSQTIRQKSATVSGKGPYKKKVIYLATIIETNNTHTYYDQAHLFIIMRWTLSAKP